MRYFLIFLFTLSMIYLFMSFVYASDLKEDEEVIFFPTYAYSSDTFLRASIHAWVFELEEDSNFRNYLISEMEKYFNKKNIVDYNSKAFEEKIRYFLSDNERSKMLTIKLLGNDYKLKRTAPSGHSITKIILPYKLKKIEKFRYTISVKGVENKNIFGEIYAIPSEGVSVISDIDDTIKHSDVMNKEELVKNVFIRPYKEVPDMSLYYKKLSKSGVAFHYVSGSPWQLYRPLNDFMKKYNFPGGSIHLKDFRIKGRSGLKFVTGKQKDYKIKTIKSIINDFPKRKFILIGDSGEQDPEIYAEIKKQYPDNILYVCIRDMGNFSKNSDRCKSVKDIVGEDKLKVFKSGKDLTSFKIGI